jgi:hypothetical protein
MDCKVEEIQHKLWDISFNQYFDEESHTLFFNQCLKLIGHARTLEAWRESPYSSVISICSQDTLYQLSKMWSAWSPSSKTAQQEFFDEMQKFQKIVIDHFNEDEKSGPLIHAARAAGPLLQNAILILGDGPRVYWRQGGIRPSSLKNAPKREYANPTFIRTSFPNSEMHSGAFPLQGFHLYRSSALVKGSSDTSRDNRPQSDFDDFVKEAFDQFVEWCTKSRSALLRAKDTFEIRIRFFTGDALTFCPALSAYASGSRSPGYFVKPWSTTLVELNGDDYLPSASFPAPSKFNVIETSNLTDHVGLLNLLSVVIPLLSPTPSSVIYTESILRGADSDVNKGFRDDLCVDPAIFQVLFGISPVSSSFYTTSRSNTHELIIKACVLAPNGETQNEERLTWKNAQGSTTFLGHNKNTSSQIPAVIFDPVQLAALLRDIYDKMFYREGWTNRSIEKLDRRAREWFDHYHYNRKSFVDLLAAARRRLPFVNWGMVMVHFMASLNESEMKKTRRDFFLDLMCQLHLQGIVFLENIPPLSSSTFSVHGKRFSRWTSFPPIIRVVFVVPKDRLTKYEDTLKRISVTYGPRFQVDIDDSDCPPSAFACLNVCFGRVISSPTPDGKGNIIIEEDTQGIKGSDPLVVSFWMPICLVLGPHYKTPRTCKFSLSLQGMPSTASKFYRLLGFNLSFYTTDLNDEDHLFFSRETPPGMSSLPVMNLASSTPPKPDKSKGQPITHVVLTNNSMEISTFTMHIDVVNPDQKKLLLDGADVSLSQVSACKVVAKLSEHRLDFTFPYPVDVEAAKLRIARKSAYIEVRYPDL